MLGRPGPPIARNHSVRPNPQTTKDACARGGVAQPLGDRGWKFPIRHRNGVVTPPASKATPGWGEDRMTRSKDRETKSEWRWLAPDSALSTRAPRAPGAGLGARPVIKMETWGSEGGTMPSLEARRGVAGSRPRPRPAVATLGKVGARAGPRERSEVWRGGRAGEGRWPARGARAGGRGAPGTPPGSAPRAGR